VKLTPYKPKYDFYFNTHEDAELGHRSVTFYVEGDQESPIKISRGEERIFVWCLYLALFEVEGWADSQDAHFFIDDPVSSLDDHNIFVTAATLYDLIESQYEKRKIIIATHHIGLFSILSDWLTKGEKSSKYKPRTKLQVLKSKEGELILETPNNNVFLYHLQLLQTLDKANQEQLYTYHFALLRQVLENVSSFLGVGQISYVLNEIGIEDTDEVSNIVNALSHKNVYYFENAVMSSDNENLFKNIFDKLKDKYKFVLHTSNS
jgi:wobble nucleotide-excising tRNase